MNADPDQFRPQRVSKAYTRVILMPRWGVLRVLTREVMISLPRVTMIDGPAEENAAEPG